MAHPSKRTGERGVGRCPSCKGEQRLGRCASCGWRSEKVIAYDERRSVEPRPAGYVEVMPPPKNVIMSQGFGSRPGHAIAKEWTCPVCDGKGHPPSNPWDGCVMCSGKGVVGETLFRRWWQSRPRLIGSR